MVYNERKNMKENVHMHQLALDYIQKLLSIPSPTGFTGMAADYLMETLQGMGFSPVKHRKGGVWCELGGEGKGLLLSAHVDTLGAMVRSVKGNGRIRYTHIGGWADSTVETENCLVHTRDGRTYSATVQSTKASQHVFGDMNGDTRGENTLEIVLDEVVKRKQDVEKLGIETGCFISWDPRTVLTGSGYLKSRHLDDKASAGMLLALAQWVAEGKVKLNRRVAILFTVFEEVGHGASMQLPDGIEDILAVDMGCVGDDLACDETMVSICVKDSAGPYHYEFTNELIAMAKEKGIDYAADVYPSYSSDTATALRAGNDCRFALIGTGVFASHGYERTHVKGIENTCRLILAVLA
ncbi:MAG: M42 family metallopeptidase [Clostridia bacterium]|nr:M42 family metallopeptidase [Clostridia bacterium]